MFKDKGFIKFKDGEYEVTINYLNKAEYLVGITLGDSNKVKYFKSHPELTATEGPRGTEFVDVHVEVDSESNLASKVYEEMTELNHNHFKEFDERLVAVKIILK